MSYHYSNSIQEVLDNPNSLRSFKFFFNDRHPFELYSVNFESIYSNTNILFMYLALDRDYRIY